MTTQRTTPQARARAAYERERLLNKARAEAARHLIRRHRDRLGVEPE